VLGFSAIPFAGGEGQGVEKLEGLEPHLWVVLGSGEVLGSGSSTEQGGRGWLSSAAAPVR